LQRWHEKYQASPTQASAKTVSETLMPIVAAAVGAMVITDMEVAEGAAEGATGEAITATIWKTIKKINQ
jgi:hypothetical protein